MLEMKLQELKKDVIKEADMAYLMLEKTCTGFFERKEELFREVNTMEEKLNSLEMDIEEEAISLMALHQPEAKNLRSIIMMIKMNNDLERIGDHVINITKCASRIHDRSISIKYIELPMMFQETLKMLKNAISSFTNQDTGLASEVMSSDDLVDNLRDQIFRINMSYMLSNPETTPVRMQMNEIASHLERIADLATNLSEEIIFMVKGRVVKHNVTQEK